MVLLLVAGVAVTLGMLLNTTRASDMAGLDIEEERYSWLGMAAVAVFVRPNQPSTRWRLYLSVSMFVPGQMPW